MLYKAVAVTLLLVERASASAGEDNEHQHFDCEFLWANLMDKRGVKIKAVVEETRNPMDIHKMTVPRILEMEETTAEGEVITYNGEEVRGLLDLDIARMLKVEPAKVFKDNAARCGGMLRDLGKFLGEKSPVFQRDARLLGISNPSDSFVAWSIYNLKLEKAFTDRFTEENACDIEFDVCYNKEVKRTLRKGTKTKQKKKSFSVDASWVPGLDQFRLLSLNAKGKNLFKDGAKRSRLHSDLYDGKHVVTTETVPDFVLPDSSCKLFIKYTDWQLRLLLRDSIKMTPCETTKAGGGHGQSEGMGYLMWFEHDKTRVKNDKKADKRSKSKDIHGQRLTPEVHVMGYIMPTSL
ncbi:hypothetical protein FOL47_006697 [Perkinsus chesapeaki]|uniref:Uncharacterized protein n=1 Tax=Perkinsus chesapeaki TaxID=330153 RepID=A0A7J6MWU0_PERCH|nr:hypothetical protein FOL47_006697 [Perkinsus chesapeaki]